MKKLIPFVLAVWVVAMVGCTATTTTTSTTSTTASQKSPAATTDPTLDNTRTSNTMNLGPR